MVYGVSPQYLSSGWGVDGFSLQHFWDSSVSPHVAVVCSFPLLYGVPLFEYTTVDLPIILLTDIWVVSRKYVAMIILVHVFFFVVHIRTYWCRLVCFCLVKESNCQWRFFHWALVSISGGPEFPLGPVTPKLGSSLPARGLSITYWFNISGLYIVCPALHKVPETQLGAFQVPADRVLDYIAYYCIPSSWIRA